MPFLLGILALAILTVLVQVPGAVHRTPARRPLADPDDQDLDFNAALQAGPLPRYSEEREA